MEQRFLAAVLRVSQVLSNCVKLNIAVKETFLRNLPAITGPHASETN